MGLGRGLHKNSNIRWWQWPLLALPVALFSRSAAVGSDTIVYCAAGEGRDLADNSGKFFRNRQVDFGIEALLDVHESSAKELWEFSEQLITKASSQTT